MRTYLGTIHTDTYWTMHINIYGCIDVSRSIYRYISIDFIDISRLIPLWVSICSCCWYELYTSFETRISIIYKCNFSELFMQAQHTQKINRIKFKKDMLALGLEPNTCFLHEQLHSTTVPPELRLNTSNVWKYRRLFHLQFIWHKLL
jgi:hypothetical protein